ncbi:hypothetical protein XELAEV_18000246mg [Xenopus laevis]|uniref:Olfactory receptor n=1 Tax=Xenopus laevis TaxID=8355 RepID=A0A974BQU9_XENLA|nr:hypothetical protein XELAEV_18000246mg [Xenopus laevis]
MKNQSVSDHLYFLAFSGYGEKQPLLSIVIFLIYVIGALGNQIIINVIYLDTHTPMYFFLCALALVNICYPTVTLPKLMDILLSGRNSMTFVQCFTQMYLFSALAAVKVTAMAYDRYVTICKPLRYHLIMNKRACVLAIVGTWIFGFINSAWFTSVVSKLLLCHTKRIKQFFCYVKAVADISCDTITFYSSIYAETFSLELMTFALNVISYIRNILHIKSKHGRQNIFSTCTSCFSALIIFYGSALWAYLRLPLESESLDPVLSRDVANCSPAN